MKAITVPVFAPTMHNISTLQRSNPYSSQSQSERKSGQAKSDQVHSAARRRQRNRRGGFRPKRRQRPRRTFSGGSR